jgi:hypothetical protein
MNEDEKRRLREMLALFADSDLHEFRDLMEDLKNRGKPAELTLASIELIDAELTKRASYRLVD